VRKRLFPLILIIAFALPVPLPAQKKKSTSDLPAEHQKWLEEEVVYIISKKEREVFLQLESNRERNIFIEAFWNQRDPTPGTTENEYKTEHYKRVAYANQWFGRDSPGPGWHTDMGRVYIQIGEAKSTEKYENEPEIYPTIVWFYDGMSEYGLPNAFSVVFFKRGGMGEYELYSPIRHGPQSLLIHYSGDSANYEAAYSQLADVSLNLAELSISLIQGESHYSLQPSLSSQILLDARIPSVPYERVKTAYAEKLLKYKDVVEVEYSANYIDSQTVFAVFQDESGLSFVHYALEPQRLSIEEYQGRYRSEIEISGKATDEQGTTVYQFSRTVPMEFSRDQVDQIKSKLFSFQDLFPLLPGRYQVDILFKNRVSQEFTSAEATVFLPGPKVFSLSPPLLANRVDPESKYKGSNKAFLLGNVQYVPSPRNDFSLGETIHLYFQLHGLPQDLKERGTIAYTILSEGTEVRTFSRSPGEYTQLPNILEEISLTGLKPAHYEIKVSVLDGEKKEQLSASVRFYISPVTALPRPWVLSLPQPPSNDPSFANILGNQYWSKKDVTRAKPLLEAAYQRAPTTEKYALDYCQVLLAAKDYQGAREVALPFLKDEKKKHNFLQLLGQSSQALGDYAQAIYYYQEYLSYFGTNIIVLNSIGDCYVQLGDTAAALVAWEKSLEIEPKQAGLRERVRALKEKK
jgi:GWxTD domain-containing protein